MIDCNNWKLELSSVELGMSSLRVQFGLYWVFNVDQTFTWRCPVGSWIMRLDFDWMRNQRNEYRYKRQEDPRAESYGITTFRDQEEEAESVKNTEKK